MEIVIKSQGEAAARRLENGTREYSPRPVLCNADVPDDKLTGKHPAFLHSDSPRRNIAFQ